MKHDPALPRASLDRRASGPWAKAVLKTPALTCRVYTRASTPDIRGLEQSAESRLGRSFKEVHGDGIGRLTNDRDSRRNAFSAEMTTSSDACSIRDEADIGL